MTTDPQPEDASRVEDSPAAPSTANQPDPPADGAAPARPPVLAGYELLESIGRGAMGTVYKARQQGLDRLVAIKIISPRRLRSPDALRRFRREVRAAARLNHPNVVAVYATDLDGPVPYLAMEYVDGIDLRRLVAAAGPLPVADACRYVLQAAEGLAHAHECGLIHRDVKPSNLMVAPNPRAGGRADRARVKVLDLGLARSVFSDFAESGELTSADTVIGTADYMAPEQAEDPRSADVRSDIYGLGAAFFYMLTGRSPLGPGSIAEKLRRIVARGEPPDPLALRPDVGAEVAAVVRRMMAPAPENRFQTMPVLFAALEPLAARAPAAEARKPEPAALLVAERAVAAHEGGVRSLAIDAAGRLLVTGGRDGALRAWDAASLTEIRRVAAGAGAAGQIALGPGGRWVAACSREPAVRLWDVTSGAERRLGGLSDRPLSLAVSADGRRMAAGCADGSVVVWVVRGGGGRAQRLAGPGGSINAVAFSLSGRSLLTGSDDGTVRKWSLNTGLVKAALPARVGRVRSLAVDGLSRQLAAGGDGLAVRQPAGPFATAAGSRPTLAVAFSPDGQWVLAGGADGTVGVWRADDAEPEAELEGHAGPVTCVAWAPDGRSLYTGGRDGTLRRWLWRADG